MSNITLNINVYAEPPSTSVNKFYPYWIYCVTPRMEQAKKQLEMTVKEMQKCRY